MTGIEVTVICITARVTCGIEHLIESLEQQTVGVDFFELVYCDRLWEEREDEMKRILSESKLHYQYVRDDPPQPGPCPSTARNKCLAKARGAYIISVDDLTILPPDLVAGHFAYYQRGYDAVTASFEVQGEVREGLDESPDRRVEGWPAYDRMDTGESWAAQQFHGMHVGFTKAMAYKVNGYDSLFDGVYGQEDIDIGIRLSHAGACVVWAPELKVLLLRDERHSSTHDSLLAKHNIPVPVALIQGRIRWRNDRLVTHLSQNRKRFRANPHFDISNGEWK